MGTDGTPTTDKTTSDLVMDERDGFVALLTINRPERLNALDLGVLQALDARLDALRDDHSVRAVVLTGAGTRAFVAGADIAALREMGYPEAYHFSEYGNSVLHKIERLDKPVIAAVNGFALGGGCELALACDVIIASSRARFGFPEVTLGVIPGFGGTQRLARLIGRNAAKHWVMTGDIYTAAEAERIGLVYQQHEPEILMERVMETARHMSERGPLAVAEAKRIINRGVELPLEYALEWESRIFARLFETADQGEGMDAFLTKRPPKFEGR